jgi:hypothetical protein
LHISEDSGGSPKAASGNEGSPIKISFLKSKPRKTLSSFQTESKPKFLKLFESVKILENSVLLLACQVVGEPRPILTWYKDGIELKSNSRVNLVNSSNGASSLYIARALLNDSGVYQVSASNDHGVTIYNAEVDIEPSKDYNSDENVFIGNREIMSKSIKERVFSTKKNEMAKVKCQVKKDDAKVDWFKNENIISDKSFENTNKYKVIESGKDRILYIQDVHTEDEGEYVCQSGKYRTSLFLTISDKRSLMSSDDEEYDIYFHDDLKLRKGRGPAKSNRIPTINKDFIVNEGKTVFITIVLINGVNPSVKVSAAFRTSW